MTQIGPRLSNHEWDNCPMCVIASVKITDKSNVAQGIHFSSVTNTKNPVCSIFCSHLSVSFTEGKKWNVLPVKLVPLNVNKNIIIGIVDCQLRLEFYCNVSITLTEKRKMFIAYFLCFNIVRLIGWIYFFVPSHVQFWKGRWLIV